MATNSLSNAHESEARRPTFFDLRQRMVEEDLRDRGIHDARVLEAMEIVPREEFVPHDLRFAAYDDCALPIGFDQTISQPFTVALMCQALQLRGGEKVLEIGTGSGYGAAVLGKLAAEVFSIERIEPLAELARERLSRLRFDNVQVVTGDGTLGIPQLAPFDGIVVTAGAEILPDTYVEQLGEGGRIVIPLGSDRHNQTMYRFTRWQGKLRADDLGSFAFVPLIGKLGWSDRDLS
ncbi:MAG: protein-L-isoaspartate(D-aspartate) O-methyltransferase [Planctomycetales bacterium]